MTTYTAEQVSDLAQSVLDALQPGLQVRVARVDFNSDPPADNVRLNVAGEVTVRVGAASESNEQGRRTFVVASQYDLTTLRSLEDGSTEVFGWKCTVDVHAQWSTSAATLTDDQLRAFAVRVGMLTIHPYARAQVQSAVSASGWGAFTIDVIGQQDHLFASEDDPEVLDLESIELLTEDDAAKG